MDVDRAQDGGLARWQLAVPLLILLTALMATHGLRRMDQWIYDSLASTFTLPPADDLALVAIDEASLTRLGQWPWPRTRHAELIERLAKAGAKVVVFDVLFTEPARKQMEDIRLANAMKRHGNVVLPLHLYPGKSQRPLSEFLPTARLTDAAARLGHAHVELDEDGIARGLYLYEGLGEAVWPSLAVAAAQLAGVEVPQPARRKVQPFVNVRQGKALIPFAGLGGAIPTYSYVDVLDGRVEDRALMGKVVFVGATAAGFGDVLPTPVSGNAYPLSGVEFHANVYSALAQDALITPVPDALRWFVGLLVVLWIVVAFPRMRPGQTLALTSLLVLGVLAVTVLLYAVDFRWLPPSAILLTLALSYPLWSARRLAVLNRFLNRQLDALGQEPGLALRAPEQRSPLRLFDQLQEIMTPDRGWLSFNGQPLRGSPPDLPPLGDNGRWHHDDTTSRILLRRSQGEYELGLQWNDTERSATAAGYLNRLSLQSRQLPRISRVPLERLERRIEQVRRATRTLAEMRSFIGQGFERMPDGVLVTDALGVIQFVNGHIAQWFQHPPESLVGMPLIRLLEGNDDEPSIDWRGAILDTLENGSQHSHDQRRHERDLLIHLAPFATPDNARVGLIANVADITDLREQQRQYREAVDFISHDVRSPLVSQLALIEQLKRGESPVTNEQLDKVALLARRSYQLAEEFVQLARAEQLSSTRFYECELLDIVENALDSVRDMALAKQIEISLSGEEDLWLNGNAELLERAVTNLLTNAIQYSPADSKVQVSVQGQHRYAVVSVQDQGPGVPPEDQQQLFERFRRHRSQELGGSHGAGLGLSFVQVVAEKHGGMVDLHSIPGRGATFRLYLPRGEE
ncbi:CHASE2 domain-containing protein [Marinobacteraceae bacterium S3BR75-40.1]